VFSLFYILGCALFSFIGVEVLFLLLRVARSFSSSGLLGFVYIIPVTIPNEDFYVYIYISMYICMCVNVLILVLLTVFHVLMLPNAWLLCLYLEIIVLVNLPILI
jgi:hypothetical protein